MEILKRGKFWSGIVLLLSLLVQPVQALEDDDVPEQDPPSTAGSVPLLQVDTENFSPDEILVKFSPQAIASRLRIAQGKALQNVNQGKALQALSAYGEYKVNPITKIIRNGKNRLKTSANPHTSDIHRWHIIKLPPGISVEKALELFGEDIDVEVVEPNFKVSITATPDDPRYPELWGLHNIGQTGGTPDADIDSPEAWNFATGSHDVIVAIIDTGVDYTHEDLVDNMWVNEGEIAGNNIDDDGNGYIDDVHGFNFVTNSADPMDDHGHGTHVAGTIAGAGNNGIGVVGVNWRARMMALKFLSARGGGFVSDAVEAVAYAAAMGASVTNNSWGGGGFSQALLDAINAGGKTGSVFVAAAGNDRRDADARPMYPAAYDSEYIISVAATNHNDELASFSNWGKISVDLAAPGVNILSSVPLGSCPLCDSSGYKSLRGTSMATPHVSGAAALIKSVAPGQTVAELKALLMETVDTPLSLADTSVTDGRLNIVNVMNRLDYSFTIEPLDITIRQGESGVVNVIASTFENFSGPLTLRVESDETLLSLHLGANTINPAPGDVGHFTVTIFADATLQAGNYSYRLYSTDANGTEKLFEANVRVLGSDYTILVTPGSRTIDAARSTTYLAQIESIKGETGPVTLSLAVDDPTITADFETNPVYLTPNGTTNVNVTIYTTVETASGAHPLTIIATNGGVNRTARSLLNIIKEPDLVASVAAPAQSGVGGRIPVNVTLTNQGGLGIGNSRTITYWSLVLATDAEGVNVVQTLFNSGIRNAFAPGGSYNYNRIYILDSTLEPGQYYLVTDVDTRNNHQESDETNNRASQAINIVAYDADADITGLVSARATLPAGESLSLTATISNRGSNPLSDLSVDYYLSTDSTITAEDFLVGSSSLGIIGGGSSSNNVRNTLYIAPGTYYIGAIVDGANTISETDETNNVYVGDTIEVVAGRDMISSVTAPAQSGVGGRIPVNVTLTNQGGLSVGSRRTITYWSLVLATDAEGVNVVQTLFNSGIRNAFAPGGSYNYSRTYTLDSTLEPGQYYLVTDVDTPNNYQESDETNNRASQVINIVDATPPA